MRETRQHHIESLAALVLLAVFAALALSVLLTGAGAYERLTARGAGAYDLRTAAQYVATRVRQADRAGAVTVEDFGGVSALVLTEEYDGASYRTAVYAYDGALRELFAAADAGLAPADGEIIMAVQDISFTLESDVLTFRLTTEAGETAEQALALRSGEGAAA